VAKTYRKNAYLLQEDDVEYNAEMQMPEEQKLTLDEAKERFGITEETIAKIEKKYNVNVEIYSNGLLDCKYKKVIA